LPISNRRPHDADNQWSNFEGTPGAEIYEPLKPMQDDIVVKKFRYSGFYATQLENLLRALGRDTIAITGVATNVCCDSTARDGAMRDFKVSFCRIAAHLFRRKSRMRP
jgi:ureidoacrylate peracid hydrolase